MAHQAEEYVAWLEGIGHPVDDAAAVVSLLRENQVADQNAALQQTVPIHPKRAGLPEHLQDRSSGGFGVVRCGGVTRGKRRVRIFQIGQVDLHQPLQHPQRFDGFIARTVPHYGDAKLQTVERLRDGAGIVARCDEVDVVHALIAQLQENVPQPLDGDLPAELIAAERVVLAEHAPQIAPGEKHGAAAARAGDARLLAEMGRGACDDRRLRRAAKAGLSGGAIRTTAARTKTAG